MRHCQFPCKRWQDAQCANAAWPAGAASVGGAENLLLRLGIAGSAMMPNFEPAPEAPAQANDGGEGFAPCPQINPLNAALESPCRTRTAVAGIWYAQVRA